MKKLLNNIYIKSQKSNYHTNILGVVRSLLALSTLLVILLNPIDILFHTGLGVPEIPVCNNTFLSSINFFCIFSSNLFLAKIVASSILLFIISGYYPKITGLLHWWITLSVNTGLMILDGGAQVATMLTFLIIPLTLTDNRLNHWFKSKSTKNEYYKISDYFTIQVLKLQVGIIYFDAAISKLFASHWTEGTSLYYFFNDPISGANGIILDLFNSIFNIPLFLVVSTYSIIFLELALVFSIFTPNKYIKHRLFIGAIIFHTLIFLIFGIFTFVIVMLSALILLLIPIDKNLNFNIFNYKTNKT